LCDNKGPTLSVIKTTAGHTFGGFTTISWDSTTNNYKNDTQSFLFSVDKQTKYPIVNSYQNAIYCYSSYGPTFGAHNIYVADNSNSNTSSYVRSAKEYNIPNGANGTHSILNDGNSSFQTTEFEVYLVQ
jgi:hypothetical protein